MTTPQIEGGSAANDVISWGLGWRIAQTRHGALFGQGGENPVFGAKVLEQLAPEISSWLHS